MSEHPRSVVYQSEIKLRHFSLWRSRYLVLFGDDVLSWFRSKQQFEETQDQPMESIDLLEICSLMIEGDQKIRVHTTSGLTLLFKARDDKEATVWVAVINEIKARLQCRTDKLLQASNKSVHWDCSVWEAYISATVKLVQTGHRSKVYSARPVEAPDELHLIKVSPLQSGVVVTETQVAAWHLGSATNPHMCQLYGVYIWEDHIALAMELVPDALPLSEYSGELSVQTVKRITLRLACSCLLLHNAGVSHHRLSLAALLISKAYSSVDFKLTPMECNDVGQLGCEDEGMLKDVYDLGRIVQQLLQDRTDLNAAHLLRLLCAAPDKRCSMQDVVLHPWLAGLEDHQAEADSISELSLSSDRELVRHAVLEPHVISTGQEGARSRSHTWNSCSVLDAQAVLPCATTEEALETRCGDHYVEDSDSDKLLRRDSLARVSHTYQQDVLLERGSGITEVVVPIAEAGSVLHLELQVEGKLRNHDVTVSLLFLELNPLEPQTLTPLMGKRVVSSLSQKFVVQGQGQVRVLLENRRGGWTKRKVHLSTLVRGPSTTNLRSPVAPQTSLDQPLAVLKVQVLEAHGPLAQSKLCRVALSVDGSKPQLLQFENDTDEWNTCSSCVLPIPRHSSVVLAALCTSKAALADPVGRSSAHGLLMASQFLDKLSWSQILSNQRSCLSLATTLVLVPGPVEGSAILDEVQAMDATGGPEDSTCLKLRVSFELMPAQQGTMERLAGLMASYAQPVTQPAQQDPQWASILGPSRMLGDFKPGATEQDFHSHVLRDHKARLLKCAAATGELVAWLEGLAQWQEPRLTAVLLVGYLGFCWYGQLWQLPLMIAASILVMGAVNGTTLWRSRPDRSGQSLRAKYLKYKGYLATAQNSLGQLASGLERLLNLWHWQEKRASSIFALVVMSLACVGSTVLLVVHLLGTRSVGVCIGLVLMRPPLLRWQNRRKESNNQILRILKSRLWNLFLHVPDALEVTLRAACDGHAQIDDLQPKFPKKTQSNGKDQNIKTS